MQGKIRGRDKENVFENPSKPMNYEICDYFLFHFAYNDHTKTDVNLFCYGYYIFFLLTVSLVLSAFDLDKCILTWLSVTTHLLIENFYVVFLTMLLNCKQLHWTKPNTKACLCQWCDVNEIIHCIALARLESPPKWK